MDSFDFDFASAVNNADYGTLVDLAAQHRSKKYQFSFCEELKNIEKENKLVPLMKQLKKILMEYVTESLNDNTAIDWAAVSPEQCKTTGHFIQATTDIGIACIQSDLASKCLDELLEIAVFLHGIMLPMPDNMDQVKNFIAHYCEKLFLANRFENGENFLNNVVLYLIRRTLVEKAVKTDVKRLYAIRRILPIILDEDRPNTAPLWFLLLDCVISPVYYSILEGQKLIALFMTLDYRQQLKIHEKIKNYVTGTTVKIGIAYGRIYFEGWCYTVKTGKEQMRNSFELNCLQDLIVLGIEKQRKQILAVIRKVLHHFFIHKKELEVSQLLYSVFQPLIWRYIKSPNGVHRAGAAQLLLDIFPLEDPNKRVVKNDLEVNEQLIMIRHLLLDDFPIVRIATVLGVCLSMSVNWEVYPEEILKTFFRIIVEDLSRDSASFEVRLAVIKAVRCLLENPLAMRCLNAILPKLSGLLHDTNEHVRIAYCQLLLKVKKISAIKYFRVVPICHLLARLEIDSYAVQKCLSNLLHNSYFPKSQDPKLWLGRCLEMLKKDRVAARVFFSHVSSFIGVEPSVRFMIQAGRAIHFYVKTKSCSSRKDLEISDKENIRNYSQYVSTLESAVGLNNLDTVGALMEALAVMWLSLRVNSTNMTSDNKSCIKMLVGKLGSPFQDLCLYYKDLEAWEPVFYVSSFVPAEYVPGLPSLCFMRLKNLPLDAQENDYLTLVECLVNQNQTHELMIVLKEWIEAGLNNSNLVPPPAKKRRRSKRKIEVVYQDQVKPALANRVLASLLKFRNLQKRILVERSTLQDILYFEDIVKEKLEKDDARFMSKAEADFLELLIYNMLKISSHLHNHPTYDQATSVPFINNFVKWTTEILVPHLNSIDEEQKIFTTLVFRICKNLCGTLGDLITLGFFEADSTLYLEFVCLLLETDFEFEFLLPASKFFYKHAASSQFLILMDNGATTMMQHSLYYLSKCFALMNKESLLEKLEDKEFNEITFILASLMQIVQNHVTNLSEFSSQAFKAILKNILSLTAANCTNIVQEMAEDPFDRLSLSRAGRFFWTIISQKPQLFQTYIKQLAGVFKDSENIDISTWIAYCLILWSFMQFKTLSQPIVREMFSLVVQLKKSIHLLYPEREPDQNDLPEGSEPVDEKLILFENHCHSELIKLKKRVKSRIKKSEPPRQSQKDIHFM